jgi:hypothetical protein
MRPLHLWRYVIYYGWKGKRLTEVETDAKGRREDPPGRHEDVPRRGQAEESTSEASPLHRLR